MSDAFCFLGIEAENWNVKEFRGPISQLGNEDGFSPYGPFAWTVSSSPYVSMWLVLGYLRNYQIFWIRVFKRQSNGTQIRQIFLKYNFLLKLQSIIICNKFLLWFKFQDYNLKVISKKSILGTVNFLQRASRKVNRLFTQPRSNVKNWIVLFTYSWFIGGIHKIRWQGRGREGLLSQILLTILHTLML